MKKIAPIGLLFFCITACSPINDGTFNWIDGHRYRNLSEGGYCARDGSPVFWQRANSKNKFSEIDAKKEYCF